jgi:hypothetical protein
MEGVYQLILLAETHGRPIISANKKAADW